MTIQDFMYIYLRYILKNQIGNMSVGKYTARMLYVIFLAGEKQVIFALEYSDANWALALSWDCAFAY